MPDLESLRDFCDVKTIDLWDDSLKDHVIPDIHDSIFVISYYEYLNNRESYDRVFSVLQKTNAIVFTQDVDAIVIEQREQISLLHPYTYILDGVPLFEHGGNVYIKLSQFVGKWEYVNLHLQIANADVTVKRADSYFSLNGHSRDHRIEMINQLHNRDLLNKGRVILHQGIEKLKKGVAEQLGTQDKNDTYTCTGTINWEEGVINPVYYSKYNLEVVTETMTEAYFVTEKTIKPIMAKMPFMMVASKGYLEYLKSLGFKTFNSVFDESYDLEDSVSLRISKIVDTLEMLIESNQIYTLYDDCKEITNYNFDHMLWLSARRNYDLPKQMYDIFDSL